MFLMFKRLVCEDRAFFIGLAYRNALHTTGSVYAGSLPVQSTNN